MTRSNSRIPPALILLHRNPTTSLWDRDVNGLIAALEERLDRVFVTRAAGASGTPSTRDAVAATRFAGPHSAVVAIADGQPVDNLADLLPDSEIPLLAIRSPWNADAIAAAYNRARGFATAHESAA